MSWNFYPEEFSSYDEYVKYLKERGLALDTPERVYKEKIVMKYIDTKRLIAEIERLQKENSFIANHAFNSNMRNFYDGEVDCCKQLLSFINSLQQEQPEEICSKCIHHGKDDGYCYNPHGGMQSSINENGIYECIGFCEKEQEQ